MRRYLHGNIKKTPCGVFFHSGQRQFNRTSTGAFQSKSGSAQRNTSVQHFGRIRTHRQEAEGNPKTMGFWRRSFPISFAAERNGAAGGKYAEALKPQVSSSLFAAAGKTASRRCAKHPLPRPAARNVPLSRSLVPFFRQRKGQKTALAPAGKPPPAPAAPTSAKKEPPRGGSFLSSPFTPS